MNGSGHSLPNLGTLSQNVPLDTKTNPKTPYLCNSVYQPILEPGTPKCKS